MGTRREMVVLVMALVYLQYWMMAPPRVDAAASAAVRCSDVIQKLSPCAPFLFNPLVQRPSAQCCSSSKALDELVSRGDQRDVCLCTRDLARQTAGRIIPDHAKAFPALCGLKRVRFDPKQVCLP